MISVIVPFHNEKENLPILINKLKNELTKFKTEYEVILVDDGSTDSPTPIQSGSKFKIITHRKRLGKGRALVDGFKSSKGDVIVFMDGDLQDEPQELGKFIRKIKSGYDFVNGWRKKRKDGLSKTLPSSIFNFLILKPLLRSKFHDVNCGYKAMKRKVLDEISLYGDNYRFLPIMAEREGFRTTEVEVVHHPRKYGKSKYGTVRILLGLFDTLTTYFVYRFSEKPLHFFGPVGATIFTAGSLIVLSLSIQRIFYGRLLYRRPALQIGMLFIIVGIQIIMTGVVAELLVYLNKKNHK